MSAFEILGAEASPAVPDLARLMKNSKAIVPSILATEALDHIGKEALPELISALSDPQQTNRWRVVAAIGAIHNLAASDQTAVLVLINHLNDPDLQVATAAAQALGSLASQPDLAVPVLTKVFADPKSRLRIVSALSLSKFGEQARPSVPVLLDETGDPDSTVRAVALNTLREIAPEVWEQARKDMGGTNASPIRVQGP